MFMMMDKAPRILRITGLLLLAAAVIMGGYLVIDDYLAGYHANKLLDEMSVSPIDDTIASVELPAFEDETDNALEIDAWESEPVMASAAAQKKTYDTIGVLNIPSIKIKLPVLSEYTDKLSKVSVCRYAEDSEAGRLVIAGHNYRSHFRKLSKLNLGDEVYYTELDGTKHTYTVTETSEISMYDSGQLWEGEWDITLFTCALGDRSKRILIRCSESGNQS